MSSNEASKDKINQDREEFKEKEAALQSLEDALYQVDEESSLVVQANAKANEDKMEDYEEDEDDVFGSATDDNIAGEGALYEYKALKIRALYERDDIPNEFDFIPFIPRTIQDVENPHVTQNDYYLRVTKPNGAIGRSIQRTAKEYQDFKLVSAYNVKQGEFDDFTKKFRPEHAHTEGGKGLTMYSNPVIAVGAGMSTLNNVNIALGCPSFCSFCKEAILARPHTEFNVNEVTGYLSLTHEGVTREFPAKSSVKFYDPVNETVMYGPLQVPVAYGWPISKSSRDKLFLGVLGRFSAD